MENVYFKCMNGHTEAHPRFFCGYQYREAAATIVRFATVLFAAEPFLDKTAVSVTLDVSNEEVYISGVDSILASKSCDPWPSEEEWAKMLFSMLAEIVQ